MVDDLERKQAIERDITKVLQDDITKVLQEHDVVLTNLDARVHHDSRRTTVSIDVQGVLPP